MDIEHGIGASLTANDDFVPLHALHAVTKSLHASLDLTETLDAVTRGIVASTGFRAAVLSLSRADGSFVVVSVAAGPACRDAMLGTVFSADAWARVRELARPSGECLYFVDGRRFPHWADDIATFRLDLRSNDAVEAWHPDDALIANLRAPTGDLIGLISVDDPVDGRRPSSQQLKILELFADHAAIAIQHADMHSTLRRQQSELRHAATHDTLTGVANRTLLDAEAARMSSLPNSKMTVFVIDFDHFKSVNDTGGHQAGDEVLAAIAQRIARVIRPIDLLARIGGDEFVVVVGGPDADARIDSLVRRFEEVASEPVRTAAGHFRIGASVGAVCGSTPCDFRTLLRAADADMYRRKQRGRP